MRASRRTPWPITARIVAGLALMSCAGAARAYDDAAFLAGAGYSGLDLAVAITLLVAALAILWVAWLSIGAFQSWESGQTTAFGAASVILRGCLIIVVVGWFIR